MWFLREYRLVREDTNGSKHKPALPFPAWAGRAKESGLCIFPRKLRSVLEGSDYIAFFFFFLYMLPGQVSIIFHIYYLLNKWVSEKHWHKQFTSSIFFLALAPWTLANQHLHQSLLEHCLLFIFWALRSRKKQSRKSTHPWHVNDNSQGFYSIWTIISKKIRTWL